MHLAWKVVTLSWIYSIHGTGNRGIKTVMVVNMSYNSTQTSCPDIKLNIAKLLDKDIP